MAVSDSFLTFLLDQLASVRAVSARRMFGGVGLWSDDRFFAIVARSERVYFRVDDASRADCEREGLEPFRPYGGQSMTFSYFEVPASVLEDADELSRRAQRAIVAAEAAATMTRPKRRRKAPVRHLTRRCRGAERR